MGFFGRVFSKPFKVIKHTIGKAGETVEHIATPVKHMGRTIINVPGKVFEGAKAVGTTAYDVGKGVLGEAKNLSQATASMLRGIGGGLGSFGQFLPIILIGGGALIVYNETRKK